MIVNLKITCLEVVPFDTDWPLVKNSNFFQILQDEIAGDCVKKTLDLTKHKFSLVAVWTIVALCSNLTIDWDECTYHELMFIERFALFVDVALPDVVAKTLQPLQFRMFVGGGPDMELLCFQRQNQRIVCAIQSKKVGGSVVVYEGSTRGSFLVDYEFPKKIDDFVLLDEINVNYKRYQCIGSEKTAILLLNNSANLLQKCLFRQIPISSFGVNQEFILMIPHSFEQKEYEPIFTPQLSLWTSGESLTANLYLNKKFYCEVIVGSTAETELFVKPRSAESVIRFTSEADFRQWIEKSVRVAPLGFEAHDEIYIKCCKVGVKIDYFSLRPLQLFHGGEILKHHGIFQDACDWLTRTLICDDAMFYFTNVNDQLMANVLVYEKNKVVRFALKTIDANTIVRLDLKRYNDEPLRYLGCDEHVVAFTKLFEPKFFASKTIETVAYGAKRYLVKRSFDQQIRFCTNE